MAAKIDEMEAPAKVWQIAALDQKFDAQKILLETLVAKSDNQVSVKQFEEGLLAQREVFQAKIQVEVDKLSSRIEELEKDLEKNNGNMSKFTWIVIGTGVSIIGTAIAIIYFSQKGL